MYDMILWDGIGFSMIFYLEISTQRLQELWNGINGEYVYSP